jgi:hypothetical protein
MWAQGETILTKRGKKRWTPAEDAELVRLNNEGVSEHEIARQLGRTIIAMAARALRLKQNEPTALGGETIKAPIPNSTQRQLMQRLRTDAWRNLSTITVSAGDRLLASLVRNGWIERNDGEIRLTPAGLEALRARVRTY